MEHLEEYLPALTPLAFGIVVFGVGLAFALRDRQHRKARDAHKANDQSSVGPMVSETPTPQFSRLPR